MRNDGPSLADILAKRTPQKADTPVTPKRPVLRGAALEEARERWRQEDMARGGAWADELLTLARTSCAVDKIIDKMRIGYSRHWFEGMLYRLIDLAKAKSCRRHGG